MTNASDSSSGMQVHEGYVMDAENAAEMARLMLRDHLLTQSMGGVLPEQADVSKIYHVLDVACGPGGWLLELTTRHPHMQGVGIDISNLMIGYANHLATSNGLSNVRFQVMDATQPLQFPDSTFDLVNGRILTGFLTTQQWSALLQECARITKPGGILRLTEAEWGFTNSVAYDTLMGFDTVALSRAGHSFSPHGRTFGTTAVLRLLLRQAGFHDIQYRVHAVDYSAGTELHENYIQNVLVVCKLLQPFFVKMQLATQEEIDAIYAQMEGELLDKDFCGLDYFLTVWGRKGA